MNDLNTMRDGRKEMFIYLVRRRTEEADGRSIELHTLMSDEVDGKDPLPRAETVIIGAMDRETKISLYSTFHHHLNYRQ
ncbi:hypothetical protein chiPu_0019134 [Chiloscyllium punctatum]|uniref:Uncharacterized protein n=1 Tax=Chiloscyllium punctatum TaxID=137246 RepID=A0A401RQR5_CHIPU|nr:hypothetical protein [Chiloscyllium punctatum]